MVDSNQHVDKVEFEENQNTLQRVILLVFQKLAETSQCAYEFMSSRFSGCLEGGSSGSADNVDCPKIEEID